MGLKNKNLASLSPEDMPITDTYESCNFGKAQCIEVNGQKVGINVFPDGTPPLIFINCNLTNCKVPSGSTLTNCNTMLFQEIIPTGEVDEVIVDGEVIYSFSKEDYYAYGYYSDADTIIYYDPLKKIGSNY